MYKKSLVVVLMVILNLLISAYVYADDEDTFKSNAPDALILLDLSASMDWSPSGSDTYIWGDSTCGGTLYNFNQSPHNYLCTRIEIAKRAIFKIFDYDGNGAINSQDSNSLNIRFGYMRFYNGTVKVVQPISAPGVTTGTAYSKIYCNNSTSCSPPSSSGSCDSNAMGTSSETIAKACDSGGTPLATALGTAKSKLDDHRDADPAKACRQKFVILITDGADTYACSGDGSECQAHMYERRREVVAAAKQLADSGYKVFVIGLGSNMPSYLSNTLNWMAYYGGTDNPQATKSGSTSSYSIVNTCGDNINTCCNLSTNPAYCYPAGITACHQDTATQTATCYSGGSGISTANFQATNNDPGFLTLGGYAFLAADASTLNAALMSILKNIQASAYSFSTASIQSIRTIDENYLYEASFYPYVNTANDPLWRGYFKRFTIDAAGNVAPMSDWDAGYVILRARAAASRTMYTLLSGTLTQFTASNVTGYLGVATANEAAIVNFIRGGEQVGTDINCKLGDIFHSSPVTIGSPATYFYDRIDTATTKAFETFRNNHQRTSANGKRLILAGANDGQVHAFLAGEAANNGGKEQWSFIPPNFLTKLSLISHSAHPTGLSHQFFVDGPTSVADVWLGTGSGASKAVSDWHTLAVFAEGRGGNTTLWSQSPTCTPIAANSDYGYSPTYSVTVSGTTTYYPYYCGYYALDVTETLSAPTFKWHLGGGSTGLTPAEGSYLGEPWSKMVMGRVNIGGSEKWVGFMGGGYSGGTGGTAGKGFYVVDLTDGHMLWKFTQANDAHMVYDLAATAAAIDYDNDGFIDTVYIGDTGGNVWRFKFCLSGDSGCTSNNWSGDRFFNGAALGRPIYTIPSITQDMSNNLWIYFGTGDITDPVALPSITNNWKDIFFAVKDNDRTTMRSISDLDNESSKIFDPSSSYKGWYIYLTGNGEKILTQPTVFKGIVYYTTYIPDVSNSCSSGESWLYRLDYVTGAAAGTTSSEGRKTDAGGGIVSFTMSQGPDGSDNTYFHNSECLPGDKSCTGPGPKPPPSPLNPYNLLYWRDQRVQ